MMKIVPPTYAVLKLDENHYNPLNDALFKFVFGKEERKAID